jgi:hypothetical protein
MSNLNVFASLFTAIVVSTGFAYAPANASPQGTDILVYSGKQTSNIVKVQTLIDDLTDILSAEAHNESQDKVKFGNKLVVQIGTSKNLVDTVKKLTGAKSVNSKQLSSLTAIQQVIKFQAGTIEFDNLSNTAKSLLETFNLVDVN